MSELYALPEGWVWRKLEHTLNIIDGDRGKNYPKKDELFEDEYCLFLSAKNVTKHGFKFNINQFITKSKDEILRKGKLQRDDIITTRGTIGNIAYYDSTVPYNEIRINSGMAILRITDTTITHRFLYIFFKSPIFIEYLSNIISGAAQPQISITNLKTLNIPLPPLPEQQRIVSKLDTLFEKIDKAIALHQKNMDEADLFMGSVLNEVFGELEERYEKKSFDDISLNIRYGYTNKAKDSGNAVFIRITDIKGNGKLKNNFVYVDVNDNDLKKFKLEKSDILVARSGATAGKVALFDLDITAVFASYLIKIKPDFNQIDSSFLFYFCHSPSYWNQLIKIKIGGAQPNVNATNLKKITLGLPSLPMQQKTVTYLDAISQKTQKVKQIQKEKMKSLIALKASILDQAFRGAL